MKTFTELPGLQLREAYTWRNELVRLKKEEKKNQPAPQNVPVEGAAAVPSEPSPKTLPETPQVQADTHIKTPEERLAEFEQKREEDRTRRQGEWQALVNEIREPLVARLKEKFAWEDNRVEFALKALDVIDRRRVGDLRKIVLLKPEKPEDPVPRDGKKIDDYVYVAEYINRPRPLGEERQGKRRPSRKGRRHGKQGRSGRDDKEKRNFRGRRQGTPPRSGARQRTDRNRPSQPKISR